MRIATLALALLALGTAAPAQTTWFVDVNGTPPGTGTALDPYTSIDFALAQPSTLSGDLVLVRPGTYAETVVFPGKGVTVMSTAGPGATVIDAGGAGSAVSFLGTDGTRMRLDGFTVRNGAGTPFSGSTAGGGIHGDSALCDVVDCTIEQNQAGTGGGLYLKDCVARLRRSTVRNNTTSPSSAFFPHGGGLAAVGGSVDVTRTSFVSNMAGTFTYPGRGGAVHVASGSVVTLTSCRIRKNEGPVSGGGVYGVCTIDRCSIEGNRAQFGGGVWGASQVTDSFLAGNQADTVDETNNWGGAAQSGTVLTGCTLQDNEAFGSGGAVDGATLFGCRLTGNRAYAGEIPFSWSSGGADSSSLFDCEVSGNYCHTGSVEPARGGGAAMSTLVDCDVFDNQVQIFSSSWQPSGGGGVWGSDLTGCRVFDNHTPGRGGGAYEGTLVSCEVFDNTAGQGGGAVDASLDRCTVYGNAGGGAGGLLSVMGASAVNTIFWNNGVEVDGPGAVSVTWSDVQGGIPGTGNIALDPLFWDEAARDFHLTAGSPCIDAGNPASRPDPDGSVVDMGAHPFDPNYTGS